ncbi:hypothetical protein MNBD_GAMMA25-885 [hydrothermal vent metagenome]|uniref:DUF4124 domain-containing protein n=1 Tax=hydrothermal vent metagenome TaxID=652676 RepID=A0A3B1BB65_9ZZZZ
MLIRFFLLWISLVFCIFPVLAKAEVYRWLNEEGEIVFGDKPPKGTKADVIQVKKAGSHGMKFATPEQIEEFHNELAMPAKSNTSTGRSNLSASYCRRYRSDLNKIEIYLQHTNSVKDVEKAADLRELIKRECSGINYSKEDNRSRCQSYHQDLVKTEIYLDHTPNPRDKQRVKDLRKQMARECR